MQSVGAVPRDASPLNRRPTEVLFVALKDGLEFEEFEASRTSFAVLSSCDQSPHCETSISMENLHLCHSIPYAKIAGYEIDDTKGKKQLL